MGRILVFLLSTFLTLGNICLLKLRVIWLQNIFSVWQFSVTLQTLGVLYHTSEVFLCFMEKCDKGMILPLAKEFTKIGPIWSGGSGEPAESVETRQCNGGSSSDDKVCDLLVSNPQF